MISPQRLESLRQGFRSAAEDCVKPAAVAALGLSAYMLHFIGHLIAATGVGGNPEAIGNTIRSLPLNPQQLAHACIGLGIASEVVWTLATASITVIPLATAYLAANQLMHRSLINNIQRN